MTTGRSILGVKFRKLAAQLPYFPQALRLVWSAAPRHACLWAALVVFQGLLPIGTVYLTRSLVNALVAAVRGAGPPSGGRSVLLPMAAMAALLLLGEGARAAARWVRMAQADRVQDHISRLVHEKSLAVDLAFYDNAEFYDQLHRARSEAGYRPVALLENVGGMAQNSITLVSMLAVLVPFGPWLPGALLASTAILIPWGGPMGCVATGSLLPAASPVMVAVGRPQINDKAMHFGAYLALSFLPVIGFRDRRRALMAGLSMFLLGVLMEAGQHFSPGRAVELGDVVANGVGVSCGCSAGPADPHPDRHAPRRAQFPPAPRPAVGAGSRRGGAWQRGEGARMENSRRLAA